MREIKFRGYALEEMVNSQWIIGYGVSEIEFAEHYAKEVGRNSDWWLSTEGGYCRVIHESIGQYTGKKDKEGNEIYEDDILQESGTGKLFRCEWVDVLAAFKLVLMTEPDTMFGMSVAGDFTVVGNVHELGVG